MLRRSLGQWWVNGRRKGEAEAGVEAAEDWDEVALAHYPSILHFADMLASEVIRGLVGGLGSRC